MFSHTKAEIQKQNITIPLLHKYINIGLVPALFFCALFFTCGVYGQTENSARANSIEQNSFQSEQRKRDEIVFIDTSVEDWQQLFQATRPHIRTVVIDGQGDGLTQIATKLKNLQGVAAVHVVSHGTPGTLKLGTTALTMENLVEHDEDLRTIAHAIGQDGEILLYGCDIAAQEKGRKFVTALAGTMNVKIAASTDKTGNAGNWVLEAKSEDSAIAAPPFTSKAMETYAYNLAWSMEDFNSQNLVSNPIKLNRRKSNIFRKCSSRWHTCPQ